MQEVQLDSKVKLLDSPGVVLASGLKTDASVALRNAIRTGMSYCLKTVAFTAGKKNPAIQKKYICFSIENFIENISLYALSGGF